MDQNLIYVKTPAGEEVVKQRTRVVQRNLRPVLILVDGKATVAELAAKFDNAKMVEDGLLELEKGGFIAQVQQAPSVPEQGETVTQGNEEEKCQPSTTEPEPAPPPVIEVPNIGEQNEMRASADLGVPPMPPEIPVELPAETFVEPPVQAAVIIAVREDSDAEKMVLPPKDEPAKGALSSLLKEGFFALGKQARSVGEQGKKLTQEMKAAKSKTFSSKSKPVQPASIESSTAGDMSALSTFSDFGDLSIPPQIPKTPTRRSAKERVSEPTAAVLARDDDRSTRMAPTRRRFRPMNAVWLLLGLVLVLGLGVVFFPYNNFRPDIEKALGAGFRVPVRIGNVAVALLPKPALTLHSVEIGEKGEARIDEIRIPSLLSLVGSGQHIIPVVEISGLAMPADGLGLLLGTGRDPAGNFAVGHARFRRMALRLGDFPLRSLEGEMSFKADGKLEKASLQTEDRTLRIEAVPTEQGTTLNIEGDGWTPVDGTSYSFESMQAKGTLLPGRLVLSDIDSMFLGGALKGKWLLDWSKGMAMAGEASLTSLGARRVANAFDAGLKIDGELSGALKLQGSGKTWQEMWTNANASLDTDIVRGTVAGIDLGEAARRGAGRNARGGATKFDRLRGVILIDPRQVVGRDIRLEAGLVSANGRFAADRERRVDGLFDVSISGSVAGIRMPIKISGALPDLVAAAGR